MPVQNISAPGIGDAYQIKTDTQAMTVATVLLFVTGCFISLHVMFVPNLERLLGLSPAEDRVVQNAFFGCYLLFAYPSGRIVEWLGYQRALVVSLAVMAVGSAVFLPAAHFISFPLFLLALLLVGAGTTSLLVALNPYITVVGPANRSASRLNFAYGFSSLGRSGGAFLGGVLMVVFAMKPNMIPFSALQAGGSHDALQTYAAVVEIGIAVALGLLATVLGFLKPRSYIRSSDLTQDFRPGAFAEMLSRPESIWRYPWLLAGALTIFIYTGAEIIIVSLMLRYAESVQIANASAFILTYGALAIAGRFLGAAMLRRVHTGIVLGLAGVAATCLVLVAVITHGPVGLYALALMGLFGSVMFPSIFALGIQGLGSLTSKGSSLLIAAMVGGGVIPWAVEIFANRFGAQISLLIPSLCYAFVACFGIAAMRRRTPTDTQIPLG